MLCDLHTIERKKRDAGKGSRSMCGSAWMKSGEIAYKNDYIYVKQKVREFTDVSTKEIVHQANAQSEWRIKISIYWETCALRYE